MLPGVSTIRKMNIQREAISFLQLAQDLPEKDNLTSATNETSHYGRKYATFNVTDADSNMYVLGMRDLLIKSGKDTLEAFKDIFCLILVRCTIKKE